jgi:hypothetical protein
LASLLPLHGRWVGGSVCAAAFSPHLLTRLSLAEGNIGPGDIALVPSLHPGGVRAPKEHARHHMFGEVRLPRARGGS